MKCTCFDNFANLSTLISTCLETFSGVEENRLYQRMRKKSASICTQEVKILLEKTSKESPKDLKTPQSEKLGLVKTVFFVKKSYPIERTSVKNDNIIKTNIKLSLISLATAVRVSALWIQKQDVIVLASKVV